MVAYINFFVIRLPVLLQALVTIFCLWQASKTGKGMAIIFVIFRKLLTTIKTTFTFLATIFSLLSIFMPLVVCGLDH